MKKNLYLSLLVLLPSALSAQLSIQNMEKYSTGQSFRYVNCSPTGVSQGNSGTGNHWLFTLTPTDTTYSDVVSPAATPFASKFPTSNLAIVNSDGRFAYYNQTTAASYLGGFKDTTNDVELVYANTALSALRPIAFGDLQITDTFTSTLTEGGVTYTGGGIVKIVPDAEGMLHLPDNAYTDVLRVKLEVTETDSNTSGPSTIFINVNRTVYLWYSNNFNSALLIWDSTSISGIATLNTKTVSYLVDETLNLPNTTAKQGDFFAAVNKSTLILNGKFDAAKQYDIVLYNLNGQKIYQSAFIGNVTKQSFDLERELVPGMYIVKISDNTSGQNVIKMVKD